MLKPGKCYKHAYRGHLGCAGYTDFLINLGQLLFVLSVFPSEKERFWIYRIITNGKIGRFVTEFPEDFKEVEREHGK